MIRVGRHTDRDGQSTGERVAAVHLDGPPVTDREQAAASVLLDVLLDAAANEAGLILADFDAVTDLPAVCLTLIRARDRAIENDGGDIDWRQAWTTHIPDSSRRAY
ncbi:hypothetical protein RM574_25615 [Streptomyces sp. DSM 41982]|uniref:STAS domain-containing protein n=1 Tax=Streptomyces evansiae TaxID=3075535 RepID=A0ABD5EBW1_9ACTN|nr:MULTISPECIES: hypothetical protein [unclassified Streptomyces]MDT0418863.1 hypothetical protein [Streptomyces sp. DSM 41982]SCD62318.1 hypothetical protein GA0115246_103895 [Streptomyces sp. SolWspMP-sol7th]